MCSANWNGVRVSVPPNWYVQVKAGSLALFSESVLEHVVARVPVDAIWISMAEVPSTEAREQVVQRMLARTAVPQFPVCDTFLGGRDAWNAEWTDGTTDVTSWFVSYDHLLFEVQLSSPALRRSADELLSHSCRDVVRTISFGPPCADAAPTTSARPR